MTNRYISDRMYNLDKEYVIYTNVSNPIRRYIDKQLLNTTKNPILTLKDIHFSYFINLKINE